MTINYGPLMFVSSTIYIRPLPRVKDYQSQEISRTQGGTDRISVFIGDAMSGYGM